MRSAVAKATAPPGAALADDDRDERHADLQAFLGRAGDRLGLAALLRTLAGVGAGRVDERDDREREAVGEVHEPDRLAVALGAGHAEVAGDARAGVVALLVADHHHGAAVEAGEAAHDRVVVGEVAVAGERGPLAEERVDIVLAVRPFRVPRHQRLPPRVERAVEVVEKRGRLAVEAGRLLVHVRLAALAGHRPKLFGLALDLGEALFEVEIGLHPWLPSVGMEYRPAPGGLQQRLRRGPPCSRRSGRHRPRRR